MICVINVYIIRKRVKNIPELFEMDQKYFSLIFWLKNMPLLNIWFKNTSIDFHQACHPDKKDHLAMPSHRLRENSLFNFISPFYKSVLKCKDILLAFYTYCLHHISKLVDFCPWLLGFSLQSILVLKILIVHCRPPSYLNKRNSPSSTWLFFWNLSQPFCISKSSSSHFSLTIQMPPERHFGWLYQVTFLIYA